MNWKFDIVVQKGALVYFNVGQNVAPPSTNHAAAVTKLALGLLRNRTTSDTSSGCAIRPIGITFVMASPMAGLPSIAALTIGVSTHAGQMAFTRIS